MEHQKRKRDTHRGQDQLNTHPNEIIMKGHLADRLLQLLYITVHLDYRCVHWVWVTSVIISYRLERIGGSATYG